MKKLAVFGCGKLGAPLVSCLAEAGYNVLGIDINKELISNLSNNVVNWSEPGLQEKIAANSNNISFKDVLDESFKEVEASFIIVPTPSDDSGAFDSKFVLSAIRSICEQLLGFATEKHLIVVVSTVMPGTCENIILPMIYENYPSLKEKIELCYSPEFIALGSVIRNMEYPDMILIGESSKEAGTKLETINKKVVKNNPQVMKLTLSEAEITKIAINSYVTMKISFSNQISEICEKVPHASATRVLEAIGADSRIGTKYLKAGTSFGGPCFPRDNRAFAKFAADVNIDLSLSVATDAINNRQTDRLSKIVEKNHLKDKSIAIVGLSYKPDTDVIEESPSIRLAIKLQNSGYKVIAVDEFVRTSLNVNGLEVLKVNDLEAFGMEIGTAILFVPSKTYERVPNYLREDCTLIDLWGNWDNVSGVDENQIYLRLGNYFEK